MENEKATISPAEDDTLQGLWRSLLHLVSKARRNDARAIANVLHHFLSSDAIEERRAAEARAYDQGLKDGERAGRLAAELQYRDHVKAESGMFIDPDHIGPTRH